MSSIKTTTCKSEGCGFTIEYPTSDVFVAWAFLKAHTERHKELQTELQALTDHLEFHKSSNTLTASVMEHAEQLRNKLLLTSPALDPPISFIPIEINNPTEQPVTKDPITVSKAVSPENTPEEEPRAPINRKEIVSSPKETHVATSSSFLVKADQVPVLAQTVTEPTHNQGATPQTVVPDYTEPKGARTCDKTNMPTTVDPPVLQSCDEERHSIDVVSVLGQKNDKPHVIKPEVSQLSMNEDTYQHKISTRRKLQRCYRSRSVYSPRRHKQPNTRSSRAKNATYSRTKNVYGSRSKRVSLSRPKRVSHSIHNRVSCTRHKRISYTRPVQVIYTRAENISCSTRAKNVSRTTKAKAVSHYRSKAIPRYRDKYVSRYKEKHVSQYRDNLCRQLRSSSGHERTFRSSQKSVTSRPKHCRRHMHRMRLKPSVTIRLRKLITAQRKPTSNRLLTMIAQRTIPCSQTKYWREQIRPPDKNLQHTNTRPPYKWPSKQERYCNPVWNSDTRLSTSRRTSYKPKLHSRKASTRKVRQIATQSSCPRRAPLIYHRGLLLDTFANHSSVRPRDFTSLIRPPEMNNTQWTTTGHN